MLIYDKTSLWFSETEQKDLVIKFLWLIRYVFLFLYSLKDSENVNWQIWLTKWDKLKAHDTLIDWCTGREWSLKCMTVISAWRRSNMPFQRLSGRLNWRLNYYITRGRRVGDEKGCGKESHHPAEGAPGTPSEFGDPLVTRWGRESPHPVERAPRPPVEQPWRTRKTQRWWPSEWGSIYCSLCSVSNSLSHTNVTN